MILDGNENVRLTQDEYNRLRMFTARNGFTVGPIQTTSELLEVTILGLSDAIVEDMLEFFQTMEKAPSKVD